MIESCTAHSPTSHRSICHSRLLSAAVGLAVGLPVCGEALALDPWVTVDDVSNNGNGATATGLAGDGSGNVYAVGYRKDSSGNTSWLIRKSTNGGASFSFNSTFSLSSEYASARAVGVDAAGRVFVVGDAMDASFNTHWIVRRSIDQGQSWQTVYDHTPDAGYATASGIAIDSNGQLYVAGEVADSATFLSRWRVVTSANHGQSWTTSDAFQFPDPNVALYTGGMCVNGTSVFVVGEAEAPNLVTRWITRWTNDGGATWNLADNWIAGSGAGASGCGISQGNIYVAGSYWVPATMQSHWVVRKSSGGAWTTVEDFTDPPGYTWASAVRGDAGGTLIAAGESNDKWLTRRSTDKGQSWIDSDDFSLPGATNSQAHMVRLLNGKWYVVGTAKDSSGVDHFVVRRW